MDRRTESHGQQTHVRSKGQSQKQLWGNDVQSSRQRSEEKSDGEVEEPLDQSTLPPVVGVKTLMSLMLSLILSIKDLTWCF